MISYTVYDNVDIASPVFFLFDLAVVHHCTLCTLLRSALYVGPASFLLCEFPDTPEHFYRGAWAWRAVSGILLNNSERILFSLDLCRPPKIMRDHDHTSVLFLPLSKEWRKEHWISRRSI